MKEYYFCVNYCVKYLVVIQNLNLTSNPHYKKIYFDIFSTKSHYDAERLFLERCL